MLKKEDIGLMRDRVFTPAQKLNYIRYIFSRPAESLPYKPLTLSIVATGRCTLACDMCPTHSRIIPKDYPHIQASTSDMSLETFKRVVDAFPEALFVQIIGSGEPLLNKDFFEMVQYATVERHMRVKTFSNGTTIDSNIEKIINSPLYGITISLNGHTAGEFERMTGCPKSQYEKIYRATEKLIKARNETHSKVQVKVSFIIDRINYRNIPAMVEAGGRLGADFIFLCNFLPAPYDGFRAEERMLLAENRDAVEWIRDFYRRLPADMKRKIGLPGIVNCDRDKNACKSHFIQMRVDGEGRVSSCSTMLLNMEGHGYFYDRGVWNNEFFRTARKKFLLHDKDVLSDPCRVCPENLAESSYYA